MATIGTFTKSGEDFTGTVKTLALNVKAKIARAEKENDKAPDFRIFAGATEFGAAWKKTSGAGREYLSVKLDDPQPDQFGRIATRLLRAARLRLERGHVLIIQATAVFQRFPRRYKRGECRGCRVQIEAHLVVDRQQ